MKARSKIIAVWLVFIIGLATSFMVGRWMGRLQGNLAAEAEYPWELQRKIGLLDIQCERLRSGDKTGGFIIDVLDASTLAAIFFDQAGQQVTVSIIDSRGRQATDSWALECK